MDLENICVIILWLWVCRWIVGASYGIYLLCKVNPNVKQWDWKDDLIVGPAFWIGYGIGRAVKWLLSLRTR